MGLTEHVTVAELAAKLKIKDVRTIYDKIASGELPAVRVGHGPRAPLRIRESDVDKLLVPVEPRRPDPSHPAEPEHPDLSHETEPNQGQK